MAKNLLLIIAAAAALVIIPYSAGNNAYAAPAIIDEGDILQFPSMRITQISSGGLPAEIFAAATLAASVSCLRFPSESAVRGESAICPSPREVGYRIQITAETILLLKQRQAAAFSDFSVGDLINVYGFYNTDGSIRGLIVRNLSKPPERTFIQLDNTEVIGVAAGSPQTLIVIQRPEYPCYGFWNGAKTEAPCPLGVRSLDESAAGRSIAVPPLVRPQLDFVRKYEVRVTSKTIILDRNRGNIAFNSIAIGDKLNIYGSALDANAQVVEAEVIRDLSQPKIAREKQSIDGIITQINAGDGSFVIRTRDAKLVTVTSTLKTDIFVTIEGVLDEINNMITDVGSIRIRDKNEVEAIPIITTITPGSGSVGTQVTLGGFGFTPTQNHISFAGVTRAVQDLSSPDGKTLTFAIPATPCAPFASCAQVVLAPGSYPITVTNKNGTSNTANFQVMPLQFFMINTESLPQVVQGEKYEAALVAQGGAGTYVWSITAGNLPPGLTLTPAVCIMAPCRAPATISGFPTTPGTYPITVTLTSGAENTSKGFEIVVVQRINTVYEGALTP